MKKGKLFRLILVVVGVCVGLWQLADLAESLGPKTSRAQSPHEMSQAMQNLRALGIAPLIPAPAQRKDAAHGMAATRIGMASTLPESKQLQVFVGSSTKVSEEERTRLLAQAANERPDAGKKPAGK